MFNHFFCLLIGFCPSSYVPIIAYSDCLPETSYDPVLPCRFFSGLQKGKPPSPHQLFPEKMKVPELRKELGDLGFVNTGKKKLLKAALVEALRGLRPQSYPINFLTEDTAMLEGVIELANLSDPKDALALIHPQRYEGTILYSFTWNDANTCHSPGTCGVQSRCMAVCTCSRLQRSNRPLKVGSTCCVSPGKTAGT